MKSIKTISTIIILLFAAQINAQKIKVEEKPSETGLMNSTITHSLAYIKDGVKRPYKVTVREQRTSVAKFDKADEGMIDQSRLITPEKVAVLLTISNPFDRSDDRVVSIHYDKNVNDKLEFKSTENGFTVQVNEKVLQYVMGKGVSFPNAADKNYFKADEFDVLK